MRLFFINETDWVAATDAEQAINFYLEEIGEIEDTDIIELPEFNWPNRKVRVEDEYSDDNQVVEIPFSEYMLSISEKDLPLIVASTEW